MTFIFTLITGAIDFYVTMDVPFDATGLLDAVKQLKNYLSAIQSERLIIVSYNYYVVYDNGVIDDRRMSDLFYLKYILEVKEDV